MNQAKRKLNVNQSLKKKKRNDLDQSITCIENLSNEYFYEIFDYVDGYEVYEAFSNLNYRFQQLLNCPSLLFKISGYNEQFLRLNKHKILSMDLSLSYESKKIFSLFPIDSSFIQLESLSIDLYQGDVLIPLLIKLACLPRLFSLTIEHCGIHENLNDIYRLIFALPVLKFCKFLVDTRHIQISLPMCTNKLHSTIEYLSIYHCWTFNEFFTILSYIPQLRRLHLFNNIDTYTSIEIILPITLSNLTDISVRIANIKFDEFQLFIKKINVNLKVLRVSIQSHDITFFNASQWEKLISQSLLQLEEFYLRYSERVYEDIDYEYLIYPDEPNRFAAPFWIKRQWILDVEIDEDFINYLIRPYRKRWYEYTQDTIFDPKSTRLIITDIDSHKLDEVLEIHTARILSITQIYQLEILQQKVHPSVLINAVNLLPELDTLRIHSLSLYEPQMLDFEELITSSSIEDTSKITKVYVEEMNEMKDLDFLMELCPYMEYLKIGYIKRMDFKFILRYILKTIKHEDNDDLRSLCFRIPTADDEMIKKLKTMIYSEKLLLFNFTIKRVFDNIYLEWE